jgi:hypothetical protein
VPAGEESPLEEEFTLPDFDQEPEGAAPGQADEWMSDSMWEIPETPQALAEESPVPLDEFDLPDLDLEPEEGGEIAPGQVPAGCRKPWAGCHLLLRTSSRCRIPARWPDMKKKPLSLA